VKTLLPGVGASWVAVEQAAGAGDGWQRSELVRLPGRREAPVATNATFSGPNTGLNLKNDKLPFTHPAYVDKRLEGIKIIPAICLMVGKHTLSHTFFFFFFNSGGT